MIVSIFEEDPTNFLLNFGWYNELGWENKELFYPKHGYYRRLKRGDKNCPDAGSSVSTLVSSGVLCRCQCCCWLGCYCFSWWRWRHHFCTTNFVAICTTNFVAKFSFGKQYQKKNFFLFSNAGEEASVAGFRQHLKKDPQRPTSRMMLGVHHVWKYLCKKKYPPGFWRGGSRLPWLRWVL